jgi:hypothetical protein
MYCHLVVIDRGRVTRSSCVPATTTHFFFTPILR